MSDNAGTAELPFSGGGMGDVEKPWWDMAFLLVAPSIAVGCKRVFGLTAVWAHPYQACFKTLGEAAHRLVLLADVSASWAPLTPLCG